MDKNYQYKDQELLNELKSGSSIAFQLLFDRYSQRILRFSLSYLNNRQEAEEIVQEVFLKIWKVRSELSVEKSFGAFIFTIAKNAILNSIRKSDYHKTFVEYSKLNPQKNPLLDDELDFNELEKAYKKSIDSLPPRRKEIFVLSREKGLSNAEIAEKLGISVKTVENQMTSALADIKENLINYGFSGLIFFELFL